MAPGCRKAAVAPKMPIGAFRRSSRLNNDMSDKVQPITLADYTFDQMLEPVPGTYIWPGLLSRADQEALVAEMRACVASAPLYQCTMPRTGKPLSVAMTNLGDLGWMSDKKGYRYQTCHPRSQEPWPPIPDSLLRLWNELTGYAAPPEACLLNYYGEGARMGLHQDRDEKEPKAPVLSISLGDTAVFRLGGENRKDLTRSFKLASGDVMMLHGPSRFRFHGVDRTLFGSSTLLQGGGRLNLTLRRVNPV